MLAEEYRVCVYGPQAESLASLRELLQSLRPVEVVDCCNDAADLVEKLGDPRVRAVLAILDPTPAESLELVRLLAADWPELAIIGLSQQQDPQLVVSAIQAGCTQFVPLPATQERLIGAFEKLGVGLVPAGATGRRICVIGPSGGTGATTVACNLALEMARISGREVALADLHVGFGDVARHFAVPCQRSIAELCRPGRPADEKLIRQVVTALPCRVGILPAPDDLPNAPQLDPEALRHLLQALSHLYQAVIADTPRMPTAANWVAVEGAHAILLVMQLTATCLLNGKKLYDALLDRNIPEGRILPVINRFREDFGSITRADVEEQFRREVFATIPSDYEMVLASTDLSHPLAVDAPTSRVRVAICNVAHRLLGTKPSERATGATPPQRGLLERLLRK
jgi:pilus assembly protein CpaE